MEQWWLLFLHLSQYVTPQNTPGVYKSTDDGNTLDKYYSNYISHESHTEVLVEIAPSNTNIAYVVTFTWENHK